MPTTATGSIAARFDVPWPTGLPASAWANLPLGAAGGEAGWPALQRFHRLMTGQGHSVQMTRMCFDRLYAYEQIALAHASGDASLRELALQMFHACHYGGGRQRDLS
ncbi:hypothetical protein AACH06_17505 [Ideonella sp. DXS29W]|uniref:Uncharacterized protein n=1 Tax=Ideonella lacteola TaxID=2984193 RepID=A0ABU9BRN0_9BURK